jgi:hypothetical protein
MSFSIQNICKPEHFLGPITSAALLGGVAKAFTSLNPIAAAITGAISPISDAIDRQFANDEDFHPFTSFVISRLAICALATLAANAMGFPITFTGTILLTLSSTCILIPVAFVVIQVAARLFAAEENRTEFMNDGINVLEKMGHPLTAFIVGTLTHLNALGRDVQAVGDDDLL